MESWWPLSELSPVSGFWPPPPPPGVTVFQDKPHLPPSPAQAALREAEEEHYLRSIVRLLKNRHYVLLLVTYGMNVGVFYALSTLLNQVVLIYYPVSAVSVKLAS